MQRSGARDSHRQHPLQLQPLQRLHPLQHESQGLLQALQLGLLHPSQQPKQLLQDELPASQQPPQGFQLPPPPGAAGAGPGPGFDAPPPGEAPGRVGS
jgi:hypothetical protein